MVPGAPGSIDYSYATGNKMIPIQFSRKAVLKFYDQSIVPNITNSDFEGEIKGMGDTVVIRTIPTASITKYTRNQNLTWDDITSDPVELKVERATVYKGRMDKIDLAQLMNKNIMDEYSTDAAEQQKIYIDTEFLSEVYPFAAAANKGIAAGRKSGLYNLGAIGNVVPLTEGNILKYILMCEAVANEQNWPLTGRWIALPTWAQFLLSNSDLKDASFAGNGASSLIRGGRLGKVSNFEVFGTNLYTPVSTVEYPIIFGHRSAITFATQFTEMEYFDKLETTIGKAMRGVQVYDWKVVKPEGMGVLYAQMG